MTKYAPNFALLALALLSGCGARPFNSVNSVSYGDGIGKTGKHESFSRVFAWDSSYSAGVGNSDGMCVQGARTARSTSLSAALELAAEKIDSKGTGAVTFAQAVMALDATNAQTSYANAGYFYLCQIELIRARAKNSVQNNDLVDMWKHVGDTAQKIKTNSAGTGSLSAPTIAQLNAPSLKAIRAYLETLEVKDIPATDEALRTAILETWEQKNPESDADGGAGSADEGQ